MNDSHNNIAPLGEDQKPRTENMPKPTDASKQDLPLAKRIQEGASGEGFTKMPLSNQKRSQAGGAAVRSLKPSSLRSRARSNPAVLWIVAIGVLVAIVLAVYMIFAFSKPDTEDLAFTITTPGEVVSGQTVQIVLEYANNSNIAFQQVLIETDFSEGFQFSEASVAPTGEQNSVYTIPDLASGATNRLVISGQLFGVADESVELSATFSFIPEGASITLEDVATQTVVMNSPELTVDFDVPRSIHSGSGLTYDAEVTNNGDTAFENLQLTMAYPDGFTFGSSDPALEGERILVVERLEPKATTRILVTGILAGEEGSQKTARLQVGVTDQEGTFYRQIEAAEVTVISSPTLSVRQDIENDIAEAGDQRVFRIYVKNIGSSALSNMVLESAIESEVIDPSKLEIDNGGIYRENEKKIVWDNTVVDGLRLLEPNQEFSVSFKAASFESITAFGRNFAITSRPYVVSGERTIDGEAKTVKIKTEASFEVSKSAFDSSGNPIGTGPTTPQVGKTTTYRITWKVKNQYNDLSGTRVSAVIPLGATWASNATVSQGANLIYDPVQKTVIWNLGNLFAATADPAVAEATATFDVTITPSSDQRNKTVILLNQISFFGKDEWVQEDITMSKENLESDVVK